MTCVRACARACVRVWHECIIASTRFSTQQTKKLAKYTRKIRTRTRPHNFRKARVDAGIPTATQVGAQENKWEMSSEEFIANAVICRGSLPCTKSVTNTMVGEVEDVLPLLLKNGFINIQDDKIRISEFAHVMAEHFIGIERLLLIMKMVRDSDDPLEILSELECMDESGLREIGERKGASERKVRTRPERFKKRGTGHPEIF